MLILGVFLTLSSSAQCFQYSWLVEKKGSRQVCLDDRTFTGNLLFEASARSRIECSIRCLHEDGCAAFTFTKPSAVCRGHSFPPMSASKDAAAPGSDTWTFQSGNPCPHPCYHLVAPGTCLRLFAEGMNHSNAKTRCQRDGASLYTMKTWERRDVLKNFLLDQGRTFTRLWLDADDDSTEGMFVWGDGEILPLNSTLWFPGEPNNQNEADCLTTYEDFYLDDAPCAMLWYFVCEISV